MSSSGIRAYERTPDEFREAFQFCKIFRVRAVESDGHTVHMSRLYLLEDGKTLRTMKTVKRRKLAGLAPGFRMREDDMLLVSEDGCTSIIRRPEQVPWEDVVK